MNNLLCRKEYPTLVITIVRRFHICALTHFVEFGLASDDFTFNALESIAYIQTVSCVSDGGVLWKTCQLLIGWTKKSREKCYNFSHIFQLVVAIFFLLCFIWNTWHSRSTLFSFLFSSLTSTDIFSFIFQLFFLFNMNTLWLLLYQ